MAKASLLSKWIVMSMEPEESNLQLMLRCRLSRYNSQKRRKWDVSLDWFTNKLHQDFTGSRIWSHIGKAWKTMVKGLYQIPPRTRLELLHSNIWWLEGIELINKALIMTVAVNFSAKASGVWKTFGMIYNKILLL